MPTKQDLSQYRHDLLPLLANALQSGDSHTLEEYLTERSALPGPRMNTGLAVVFADLIAEILTRPDGPVSAAEKLLGQWSALPLEAAPINDPREMLPATAVLSYGHIGVARSDWWEDEVTKIHRAASDPRWRTRELVAAAMQKLLAANWDPALGVLSEWLSESDALVIRATVASVAEPLLLTDPKRGEAALLIQERAADWLLKLPSELRKDESVRVLRQALGFTISVAVAAAPDTGFKLLERLATSGDPDIIWVVRENLKKNRLHRWADRVAAINSLLHAAGGS